MSSSDKDEALQKLRAELAEARRELEIARAEVSAACKIVPDIGHATPDGTLMWQRAHERYRRAEATYADILKRFADTIPDFRLL